MGTKEETCELTNVCPVLLWVIIVDLVTWAVLRHVEGLSGGGSGSLHLAAGTRLRPRGGVDVDKG